MITVWALDIGFGRISDAQNHTALLKVLIVAADGALAESALVQTTSTLHDVEIHFQSSIRVLCRYCISCVDVYIFCTMTSTIIVYAKPRWYITDLDMLKIDKQIRRSPEAHHTIYNYYVITFMLHCTGQPHDKQMEQRPNNNPNLRQSGAHELRLNVKRNTSRFSRLRSTYLAGVSDGIPAGMLMTRWYIFLRFGCDAFSHVLMIPTWLYIILTLYVL